MSNDGNGDTNTRIENITKYVKQLNQMSDEEFARAYSEFLISALFCDNFHVDYDPFFGKIIDESMEKTFDPEYTETMINMACTKGYFGSALKSFLGPDGDMGEKITSKCESIIDGFSEKTLNFSEADLPLPNNLLMDPLNQAVKELIEEDGFQTAFMNTRMTPELMKNDIENAREDDLPDLIEKIQPLVSTIIYDGIDGDLVTTYLSSLLEIFKEKGGDPAYFISGSGAPGNCCIM